MDERMNVERRTQILKQRRQLCLTIKISLIVLAVLILLLMVLLLCRPERLTGVWGAEDIIVEFNGEGRGVWFQEIDIERFDYEIRRDTLVIDFQRENVMDRTYTVEYGKDQIVLRDTQGQELVLHRKR